jgi:glycosyltransferase involved in cell wall biosynthesis
VPRISCIVPVYNGATYLAEAIESILRQTLPVAEIIIVDDGSTDATPAIATLYGSRALYLRQENQGPGGARNTGLEAATGELISFLDADDVWHPEKLARQMSALEADPEVGICLTQVQNFWIDALADERDRLKDHPFSKPVVGYVCQALLARRSVFEKVGQFDRTLRVGEDTDWFMRVRAAGVRDVVVPEVLVNRRIHGNNISFEIHNSERARAALLENVIRHRKQQRSSAS